MTSRHTPARQLHRITNFAADPLALPARATILTTSAADTGGHEMPSETTAWIVADRRHLAGLRTPTA
jgi:hypothetical protein